MRGPAPEVQHRLFFISGSVQGVGFRNFVQHQARALGITGYAKNLADGRVEVMASGSAEAIDTLRGKLHRGPSWSEVRSVDEQDGAPTAAIDFDIR